MALSSEKIYDLTSFFKARNGLEGNWSPSYEEDTSQWATATFLMFLAPRTKNKEYVGLLLGKARKDIIHIYSYYLEDSRKLRNGDGIGIC